MNRSFAVSVRVIRFICKLACLLRGHHWDKTPVCGNNHSLYHCCVCGRVEFAPWGVEEKV